MGLTAHAPSLVDAHVCLAALALALVAGAPRHALVAAALVTGGAILSVPTSWDPWVSFIALPAALGPAAFFLLASTGSCRTALLWGVSAGGALNAVAAAWQKAIDWPEKLARAQELGLDEQVIATLRAARPLGLSLSPDLCGGLCLAGAFAAFALALEAPAARVDGAEPDPARPLAPEADPATVRRKRMVLAGIAAVSASGVVAVRSFGTALAFVVGIAVCAVAFALRRSLKQGLLLAGTGVVVAGAAAAVAFAVRGGDALAHSAGERVDNWRAALTIAAEHPLLGVGFMRFPAAYLATRTPDANLTRYAHSTPLEYLAEGGVVGALLVVGALVVCARALWKRRDSLGVADMVLAGGAAAYAVRLCIDYDGHVAQTASIAGVMWGLVLATEPPAPAGALQRRVTGAFVVLTAVLTGVLFFRDAALGGDDPGPLRSYAAAVPFDVEPRLKIGQQALDVLDNCVQADGCPEALALAHGALDPVVARAHPASVALVLHARVLSHEGKLNAALRDLDAALAVDPGNPLAHQLAVGIVRTLGEKDETARRVAEAERWHVTLPE